MTNETIVPPPPPRIDHVAIVGAGFSGTLQAINLLRQADGPRVTLIERRGTMGRGVAYSTPNAAHLLNVRAANMSALPDDPGHFVRWLATHGLGQPHSFASRRDYGDYLSGLLADAQARAPGRLTLRHGTAADLALLPDRVEISVDHGDPVVADAAVLALGNLPPHDPPGVAGATLPADRYVSDPWAADVARGLDDDDVVLILGTGLTMVDVALTLEEAGFGGRIVALSRHGLVPRAHVDGPPPAPRAERPQALGAGLLRTFRAHAAEIGWRHAVDELRPHTQAMWLNAPYAEQRRFIRHLRAWWDVHRHRLAPAVAARLAALRADGRLDTRAGRLVGCAPRDGGLDVTWRPRGRAGIETMRVRRIINCTGPQGDLLRTRDPLLHLLLASGHIRPDAHRFGIDVTPQAETIDASGRINPRLLALGPMTRGAFWEIVAVPDIRRQTWALARRLANAQWVAGEGL